MPEENAELYNLLKADLTQLSGQLLANSISDFSLTVSLFPPSLDALYKKLYSQ